MWWAVVLASLILAAPAQAHFGKGERDARAAAERRFPNTCQPIGIEHLPLRAPYVAYVNGTDCTVWLDPSFHTYSWRVRCHTLVHEQGHLAGYPHSTNRRNVMYPWIVTLYRGCDR